MTHIPEHSTATYPDTRLPAASSSAVSWGAIFAGAAAAASLALILLILGAGLGLTSISPWENHGLNAGTVGIAAIGWLAFTQIVASGMGGYLSGRLRTKWVDTHTDEVYFRDTAHGFLAWAVAALVSAVLLTSTLGTLVGGGLKSWVTLPAVRRVWRTSRLRYPVRQWTISSTRCSGRTIRPHLQTVQPIPRRQQSHLLLQRHPFLLHS